MQGDDEVDITGDEKGQYGDILSALVCKCRFSLPCM